MSMQTWMESLIVAQGDGAAVTNTTTATTLLPSAATLALPANFFSYVGKALRIRATGRVSTVVTTPGTLTLDIRLGTLASPIVVFNGGAMNLNTTAQTNATWSFECELTARALGSGTSANLMGVGSWSSRALIGSPAVASGYAGTALLPDTAPAVGIGFDSTITNILQMFATWSIANASNSITLHQFRAEAVN
ncbi:hypothetical protein [Bradyrhizobium sp. ORS 86]|uniref:hypothetical protein n=1 Tax=Bradyrhizobium sp. ORS 86 TaxID=1685970 RepID=UPI0038910B4D